MPKQIKISANAYQESVVTLNGKTFKLTLSFNNLSTVNRWFLDISDIQGNDLATGMKVLPNRDLTSKYSVLVEALGGMIACVNISGDKSEVTRENLITDGKFQLWYYTEQEILDAT